MNDLDLTLKEILAALFGLVTKAIAEAGGKDPNLKDTIVSSKENCLNLTFRIL